MFFILDKKKLMYISLIFVLTLFAGIIGVKAVVPSVRRDICVIIDAGHGEPDGGCVGALGTVEQKINLSVARKISEILEAKNIRTIMTRDSGLGLWTKKSTTIREKKIEDMQNRRRIMEESRSDLFISIHMNSYSGSGAKGHRVFYDTNHPHIKDLAENIEARLSDITGEENYSVKPCERNLFLLKNTPIPAILVECGFLSNPRDEEKLNTSEHQSKLAWAISDAIEKYYLHQGVNQK